MRPIRALVQAGAFLLATAVTFAEVVPSPSPEPSPTPFAVPENLPAPIQRELRRHEAERNRQQEDLRAGKALIGAEFLFVTNSYLASLAPKIYGGAGLLLFPAGALQAPASPERTTSILLMEGLAAYNLFGVDDDEMSEGEIFRANLLAWHGILISRAIVRHISARRRARMKEIAVIPLDDGAALRVAGRF